MNNLRFRLSDRFQRLGGIALTLMFILLSTASAWADTEHPDIGSIKYNSEIGAYEIKSVDNLNDLATYVNEKNSDGDQLHDCSGMTFKMTADIKYTYDANTKNNYRPIGWYPVNETSYTYRNVFKGTFDGQGHTVSGIRIDVEDGNGCYMGLFGEVKGPGSVSHVTLSDAIIIGKSGLGGIVGSINIGDGNVPTISDCHVTSDVVIESKVPNNPSGLGGIVSTNAVGLISGCTSMAIIKNSSGKEGPEYGGIVGGSDRVIKDCLYLGGPIVGNNKNVGAIAGSGTGGQITNCYYTNSDFIGKDWEGTNVTEDGVNKAVGNINPDRCTVTNVGLAHTITLGKGIALDDTYKTEYGRLTSYMSSEKGDGFALKYTTKDENDNDATILLSFVVSQTAKGVERWLSMH